MNQPRPDDAIVEALIVATRELRYVQTNARGSEAEAARRVDRLLGELAHKRKMIREAERGSVARQRQLGMTDATPWQGSLLDRKP